MMHEADTVLYSVLAMVRSAAPTENGCGASRTTFVLVHRLVLNTVLALHFQVRRRWKLGFVV